MPVKRKQNEQRALSKEAREWLGGTNNWWGLLDLEDPVGFWRKYRPDIMRKHVADAPGTRPHRWWDCDAPEPRQRLGGVGDARPDRYPMHPPSDDMCLGIPSTRAWATSSMPDVVRDGRLPIDPSNLPVFESQAAYLKRHGLLEPGEERRIPAAAFAPEIVAP